MDNNFIIILQSINTIHDLEKELSKRFGWLRFKEKRECKEFKKKITEKINSLENDVWTIDYLRSLQKSLKAFYLVLEEYMGNELYISDYDPLEESNPNVFLPIYFIDTKNKNHLIILDIVSDNISFRIMDTSTGNSFETSSALEVQSSQKKIESVCKHCLVTMLLRFLNSDKNFTD